METLPITAAPLSQAPLAAPASQDHPSVGQMIASIPGWVHIVAGGVVAAIIGAMMGGVLHI